MTEEKPAAPKRGRKPEHSGGANRKARGKKLMAIDITPEQSLRYHHAARLAGFDTLRDWVHDRLGGLPEVAKAAESFPDKSGEEIR